MGRVLPVIRLLAAFAVAAPAAANAQSIETDGNADAPTATLPTVEVIGVSPLPGLGVDREKVPSNARSLAAPDSAKQGPTGLGASLEQQLGSVTINANQNNPFQPDVQYRGFAASPILGTPIGVAVYQNGVRLNELFGDNVNWDLVPDFAINRLSVIPTNPIYGLNALGGALVIETKNGFNFQGAEGEISGGSFGRRQLTMQSGRQIGNLAAYIGANAYNDDGFRKFSPSQVRRLHADLGTEGDWGGVHVTFTGADNSLVGIGPTPAELVDIDRSNVFTSPQKYRNTLAMAALNGNYRATDAFSLQGNFYLRSAGRNLTNGDTSEVKRCDPPLSGTLCFEDPSAVLFNTSGQPVADVLGGGIPGQVNRSTTDALGLGGSLQGTFTKKLFGHDNNLVVGAALDHGTVDFDFRNELGIIDPNTLIVGSTGITIQQPDGTLTPIRLATTTDYYGFYLSDTFDVTPELAVTLGGRYNLALVRLRDKIGTALTGDNRFARVNPAAGVTYKIAPQVTGYFGYAEANRAPTAGEIACSDPARPCSLDNFLTSDPPGLKQVVAHTFEAGLRGRLAVGEGDRPGRIEWNVGLFRTDLGDDILNVPGPNISTGFFRNIGSTRRQGIEAGIAYRNKDWRLSANYSLIEATFQSAVTLASANNPAAYADGEIHVRPGDRLPGIPLHRVKANAEYQATDRWTLGGSLVFASDQYYFADQANDNAPLPGYVVVNLNTRYRIADNCELFGLVENLFDNKYATFGIFGDVTRTPLPGVPNPSNPRFVSVGAPLSAYGGLRVRF